MATIEERARDFAYSYRRKNNDLNGEKANAAYDGFIAGSESERKELTRWRDPNKELPEIGVCILIKTINSDGNNAIYMGSWEGDRYITDLGFIFGNSFDDNFDDENVLDVEAIGWREIYE